MRLIFSQFRALNIECFYMYSIADSLDQASGLTVWYNTQISLYIHETVGVMYVFYVKVMCRYVSRYA